MSGGFWYPSPVKKSGLLGVQLVPLLAGDLAAAAAGALGRCLIIGLGWEKSLVVRSCAVTPFLDVAEERLESRGCCVLAQPTDGVRRCRCPRWHEPRVAEVPGQADLVDHLALHVERLQARGDQRIAWMEPRALLTSTWSPSSIPLRRPASCRSPRTCWAPAPPARGGCGSWRPSASARSCGRWCRRTGRLRRCRSDRIVGPRSDRRARLHLGEQVLAGLSIGS